MSDLENKVLERIKKESLQPIPRWHFLLKRSLVWSMAVLSLLLGSVASGRYEKGWTACTSGNSYCGTSDAGADAKDDSTGLIWSMPCNGSGCASFSDASPITYSWDNSAANNNSRTASQLCSDNAGWSLPHQKQLMQAYIDGSYGNLDATATDRSYWLATTVSNGTPLAWYVNLSLGITNANFKTVSYYVRCVRE